MIASLRLLLRHLGACPTGFINPYGYSLLVIGNFLLTCTALEISMLVFIHDLLNLGLGFRTVLIHDYLLLREHAYEGLVKSGDVVWVTARYEVIVNYNWLIEPLCASVYEVIFKGKEAS